MVKVVTIPTNLSCPDLFQDVQSDVDVDHRRSCDGDGSPPVGPALQDRDGQGWRIILRGGLVGPGAPGLGPWEL